MLSCGYGNVCGASLRTSGSDVAGGVMGDCHARTLWKESADSVGETVPDLSEASLLTSGSSEAATASTFGWDLEGGDVIRVRCGGAVTDRAAAKPRLNFRFIKTLPPWPDPSCTSSNAAVSETGTCSANTSSDVELLGAASSFVRVSTSKE